MICAADWHLSSPSTSSDTTRVPSETALHSERRPPAFLDSISNGHDRMIFSAPNKRQKLDSGQTSPHVSPNTQVSPLRSFEPSYTAGAGQPSAASHIFDALASVSLPPAPAAPLPSVFDSTLALSASAHLEMLAASGVAPQAVPTFAAYDRKCCSGLALIDFLTDLRTT